MRSFLLPQTYRDCNSTFRSLFLAAFVLFAIMVFSRQVPSLGLVTTTSMALAIALMALLVFYGFRMISLGSRERASAESARR